MRWALLLRAQQQCMVLAIVGMLAACAGAPPQPHPHGGQGQAPASPVASPDVKPGTIAQAKSRWIPVSWADLPGFSQDALHEAWGAWIRSCTRPASASIPALSALCSDVRRLAIADAAEQRQWMMQRLQPYRVEPLASAVDGTPIRTDGLLTAYYEPVLPASRMPSSQHRVPLWQPPTSLATRRPWYTRQEIDTLPAAQAQLRGREIAYLADPIDALILQIQGSGLLLLTEPSGTQRHVRVAFAGTNEQPYKSVGRWLLDQGLIRDASWPGIKAWIATNPQRVQEMLWSNPRMVFFREELIDATVDGTSRASHWPAQQSGQRYEGPRGAQGAALTAGRSIAVDPGSIPLGTPVWIDSKGANLNLQRLVIAQDVGSAIQGAVRADYYVGSGAQAGEIAGRLKQPLNLWVLWPR